MLLELPSKIMVEFDSLVGGDLFEFEGSFYIKSDDKYGRYGVNLEDGDRKRFGAHYLVTPHRNAKITFLPEVDA